MPYARARSRILLARAMRGRSEPLRISPPSRSNSTKNSLAQADLVQRRRESLVHGRALIGGQADLAGHAEFGGDRGRLAELQSAGADGRPVDGAGQMGGLGCNREPRARVGQGGRVVAEAGVTAEVADSEGQPEGALGRGDLGDALEAAGRFHQRDDQHAGQALGRFGDVVDRFDHRQHHPADRGAGQHLEVVGPPRRSEAVDADPVAVAVAEPLDHVAARGDLVLRGDRVLDVEDDDVGAGVRRGANRSYCAPFTSSQLRASTGSIRGPELSVRLVSDFPGRTFVHRRVSAQRSAERG